MPVLDDMAGFALLLGDVEVDGFLALHALAEAVDKAFVHRGGLVDYAGDEGLANSDDALLAAYFPRRGDADGPGGTLLATEDVEALLAFGVLHNLQDVVPGWEHFLSGLYRMGSDTAVDEEGALGVEAIGLLTINSYLHNILIYEL